MTEPAKSKRFRIAGVCERDIDLVLLEEFLATPEFATWFANTAGLKDRALGTAVDASRSVTHTTGESDLEVRFESSAGRTLLLIENKIGAGLQPQQAERYRLRGADHAAKGRCDRFFTVIIAPDKYFADEAQLKGFDCRVSYEALMRWYENATFLGARRLYKLALLQSGIDKATFGYQPDVDTTVTDFFRGYWDIVVSAYSDLEMIPPKGRPGGSGRVYFRSAELTSLRADVAHKTSHGVVDLHLRDRASRMAGVEAILAAILEPDMSLASAGKSVAVRLKVQAIDRTASAVTQRAAIQECLNAARRLRDWAISHRAQIEATM